MKNRKMKKAKITPEFVRELRGKLGLAQAEFSKRVSVSERAVKYWEAGESQPRQLAEEALIRLAKSV